jgi:valyl-tRNA synthetase
LRLLHPFTPFVTEEIWGHLKHAAASHSPHLLPEDGHWADALMIAPWPTTIQDEGCEAGVIASFQQVQEIVRVIRNVRAEKAVKPSVKIPATISSSLELAHELLHEVDTIASLAILDPQAVTLVATRKRSFSRPEGHIALVAGEVEIFLPLADLVDKTEEKERLHKNLSELQAQIDRLQGLLDSPFVEKAPPAVVQKEREKLAAYLLTAEKLNAQIKALD